MVISMATLEVTFDSHLMAGSTTRSGRSARRQCGCKRRVLAKQVAGVGVYTTGFLVQVASDVLVTQRSVSSPEFKGVDYFGQFYEFLIGNIPRACDGSKITKTVDRAELGRTIPAEVAGQQITIAVVVVKPSEIRMSA